MAQWDEGPFLGRATPHRQRPPGKREEVSCLSLRVGKNRLRAHFSERAPRGVLRWGPGEAWGPGFSYCFRPCVFLASVLPLIPTATKSSVPRSGRQRRTSPPPNTHLPLLSPHPSSLRPLPLLKDEDTFWSQRYVSALGHQKLLIPNIRIPPLDCPSTLRHSSSQFTHPQCHLHGATQPQSSTSPGSAPHACAHPPGAHTGSHRRSHFLLDSQSRGSGIRPLLELAGAYLAFVQIGQLSATFQTKEGGRWGRGTAVQTVYT